MKRYLHMFLVIFGVMALSGSAHALAIQPGGELVHGTQTSTSQILEDLNATFDPDLVELFKQDVGESETGSLAGSYEAALTDSGGTITYTGGSYAGAPAYLLVKDGEQKTNPPWAWYFFDLTAMGWNGTDQLVLSDFWPDGGAISHVSLYGSTTTVPEPGTLLLLGSGLVGLAFGRRKFKA